MKKWEKVTIDPSARALLPKAQVDGVSTVWDRYEAQKPQCGFGQLGIASDD